MLVKSKSMNGVANETPNIEDIFCKAVKFRIVRQGTIRSQPFKHTNPLTDMLFGMGAGCIEIG